jgi:RNA polymerase sigma factor (sigma-70 family)
MKNDQQLIDGCRRNDRKAQKALYELFSPVLLGICCRYTRDRAEAEDVMQEGFIKIFNHISQYTGTGSFEGWMKRIMINTAITHYRANLKHFNQLDIGEIRESRIEEKAAFDAEFSQEDLLGVIQQLPRGYQMVFNLFAIEGYSHKEIGEMLGIDVGTSKSQLSRARFMLQAKLKILMRERLPARTA